MTDSMSNMGMPSPDPGLEHESPTMGMHGMAIVGEETVYLSHLPMWMRPHNFQVILQVMFTGPNNPQGRYAQDRRTTGTKLYTLQPEPFDILDLAPTGPQRLPRRASFQGTIFRNHFEFHPKTHPGDPLEIGEAEVDIKEVVFFHELDPQGPALQDLEYLLFGKGQELFLAHVISSPPDFDQLMSVQVEGVLFTDEDLRQGMLVTFPGRANTIPQKIQEGEPLSGKVQAPGQNAPGTLDVQVAAGTEYYFESEDLAVPDPMPM